MNLVSEDQLSSLLGEFIRNIVKEELSKTDPKVVLNRRQRKAAKLGEIPGAWREGRVYYALQSAVDAWTTKHPVRVVTPAEPEPDDFEEFASRPSRLRAV